MTPGQPRPAAIGPMPNESGPSTWAPPREKAGNAVPRIATSSSYIAVVTLAVGIASGGASVCVCGSQEPAPKDGQPVSNRPTSTTTRGPQPEISKKATGQRKTAELRARLRAQQLATRKAKALYEIARLTRELAELAVEEYEEVIYPGDLAIVGGEIELAESDLVVHFRINAGVRDDAPAGL